MTWAELGRTTKYVGNTSFAKIVLAIPLLSVMDAGIAILIKTMFIVRYADVN